jgi:transposase
VVGVEGWAEIRRLYFVKHLAIREIARRTGHGRNAVRRALRSPEPPRYRRPPRPSKLEPYRAEILSLLHEEPRMPGVRVRELIGELGYRGGQTIVDDYLREVRPRFLPAPRTYQRTHYRPGELCQFDLWEPDRPIPVGFSQERRGYVVIGCLGYSRAGAGALVFGKEAPDLLWGMARCLWRLGGLPGTLVWDREGALHAGQGRPSEPFARFCGQLGVGWYLCQARDPQAKGMVERLQGYAETNFAPGRAFVGPEDFQAQLDRWFAEKANRRTHRALRARPVDRLGEERAAMRPLPAPPPDTDRRFIARVAPDPYVRVDTCDYSLDPRLVGRRVEVRVTQREVLAAALDTGQVAARHRRSFARHRTVTDLEHLRLLRAGRQRPGEVEVERRPLARYDALIS